MQNPLQTIFHDIPHNGNIEALIQEKFEKVLEENPGVTKCHVVFEKLSNHHNKANMACVRLDLKVSRLEDIVVREECFEDAHSLTSAILKVFKRGLELSRKHKKRRLDNKRAPLGELREIEPVETGDEY